MTRIPGAVAVASLDTHRLIVAVPNDGPADVACNLPRPVAAAVLRQIADQLDRAPNSCGRARATGEPCLVHDRHLNDAGTAPARPAGLDALLDHVAAGLSVDEPHGHNVDEHQADGEQPTDWVDDVRSALEFNESEAHPALLTLRDVLLDTSPRPPEQALAAARVLLAAHALELAEHVNEEATRRGAEMRARGDRSRVNYCGGMRTARTLLEDRARELDEQTGQ